MLSLRLKNAEAVRKEISLRGYSINSFARKIKSNPGYIGKVLDGKRDPYPPLAKKIADGLDMDIRDLFFVVDGRKNETHH
ncbi:helix-turn-helix domain-containing protein [Fructilactobacillus cliffordii]|uniref:Helix-turn-helix domain-containing protein n=1 Tax=Fructilactobacillus cliffordii TaxID=2940299 RepID=A0A9Q8ZVZ4_9LACO|nr:helix-turn-helix transcriptional regulator [Fructilactobacillus cliffordii]USS86516.1 helix-turn-helix domain-containing protein [Fructilactobacillus cliffordii]USS89516.1 helix-turn-helix domain-containing protein [Fructilactobacillus cliffordii]